MNTNQEKKSENVTKQSETFSKEEQMHKAYNVLVNEMAYIKRIDELELYYPETDTSELEKEINNKLELLVKNNNLNFEEVYRKFRKDVEEANKHFILKGERKTDCEILLPADSVQKISDEELLSIIRSNPDLADEFRLLLEQKIAKDIQRQKKQEEESAEELKEVEEKEGKIKKKKTAQELEGERPKTEENSETVKISTTNDGLMFFCKNDKEARKKLKELKEKYPEKEFVLTKITQEEFNKLQEERLREKMKKSMQIQNDKLAETIIKELKEHQEVQVKNFPIKTPEGSLKYLKEAKLLLKKNNKTKRMEIKIEYVVNPKKIDDIYVDRTGEEKGQEPPKVVIDVKTPTEDKKIRLGENEVNKGEKISTTKIQEKSNQSEENSKAEKQVEDRKQNKGHKIKH